MRVKKSTVLGFLFVIGAVVAAQLLATGLGREYYLTQLIMAVYYGVVVMGLSLVMAYAGQISLGHGAFFAIGGYTSAVLTTARFPIDIGQGTGRILSRVGLLLAREDLYGEHIVSLSPWAAFSVAILLTFVVALIIGYPALRLKGHYLAMATLGFGLIVYRLVLGTDVTGGADGVRGVPAWNMGFGAIVSGRKAFGIRNYYIAWAFALLVLLLLSNLVRSRVGRALRAIHEGELAADAMGVNTAGYKLKAFVLSALLASAAGCFLTHYTGGIGPSEAGAMKSVRYVALVAVGGMANLWGVLLLSVLLNFLSLRGYFGTLDHAFFGVVLIVITSLAPQGPLKPIGVWVRRAWLACTAALSSSKVRTE